ncbi:MAG: hypothetical protein ACRDAS_12290, partial [Cetobacterium sp.]
GPCKDSLVSFLEYSRCFKEILDLRRYLSERPDPVPVLSEDDNVVGFEHKTLGGRSGMCPCTFLIGCSIVELVHIILSGFVIVYIISFK